MGVIEEETEHLLRGVGPSRIGVRAGGAAARPSVTGSVDDPLLEDRLPARVSVEGPAIGMPAGYPPVLHSSPQVHGRIRLACAMI